MFRHYSTPAQCSVLRGVKRCGRCDRTRKVKFFYKKENTTCGYSSWCKDCSRAYDHENRKRFQKRKEQAWLKTAYNLSPEDYDVFMLMQKKRCAICGRKFGKQRWLKPRVDHCHRTGKNRGLLCNKCNMALGLFKESLIIIKNAVAYLQRSICQNTIKY